MSAQQYIINIEFKQLYKNYYTKIETTNNHKLRWHIFANFIYLQDYFTTSSMLSDSKYLISFIS